MRWNTESGEAPEGYNVYDYFTVDGFYCGQDLDGVEPVFDSTAEQIAYAIGNDGQRFQTESGVTLDDLCKKQRGQQEWRDGYHTGDTYRWVFADGSAIVVAGEGWDIEGVEPFSWAGA